jgi:hypothetical protein
LCQIVSPKSSAVIVKWQADDQCNSNDGYYEAGRADDDAVVQFVSKIPTNDQGYDLDSAARCSVEQ